MGSKFCSRATALLQTVLLGFSSVVFTFILKIFFSHVAIFFSSSSTAVSALGGQEGTFHSPQPNLHFRHTENPGSLAASAHTPPRSTLPSPTPPASNPTSFSPRAEEAAAEDRQPREESQSPQCRLTFMGLPSPLSSFFPDFIEPVSPSQKGSANTCKLLKFSLKTVHG